MNIKTDKWYVCPITLQEIFKIAILLEAAGFDNYIYDNDNSRKHNALYKSDRGFGTIKLFGNPNNYARNSWKRISLKELQDEAIKIISNEH